MTPSKSSSFKSEKLSSEEGSDKKIKLDPVKSNEPIPLLDKKETVKRSIVRFHSYATNFSAINQTVKEESEDKRSHEDLSYKPTKKVSANFKVVISGVEQHLKTLVEKEIPSKYDISKY